MLDLSSEYRVSAAFIVFDLSLFDDADSRMNPFQQGGNDWNLESTSSASNGSSSDTHTNDQIFPSSGSDPLSNIGGPMTRSRARKMNNAINSLIMDIMDEVSKKSASIELHIVNLLQIGPTTTPAQVQIAFED